MNRAVFLDRDGVIIHDHDCITDVAQIALMEEAPHALQELKQQGFRLVVISNQAVVARGLLDEPGVSKLNVHIQDLVRQAGGPALDGWYFCPHHPKATLPQYRVDCECRKPKPGMILTAARDQGIDLPRSFFVGDRFSDIVAGHEARCKTILLETGKQTAPPIETVAPLDPSIVPDYHCSNLMEAARWILRQP